jgi:L-asparaginase II
VMEPSGACFKRVGDTSVITSMRSAAKPLQALPLIIDGASDRFQFTAPELAVIASSHSGEDMHVQNVRAILGKIGLDATYLHCGVHVPLDWGAEVDATGRDLDVLRNCCSGKHSGMLARCVFMGANPANYEDLEHPVQQRIREVIAEVAEVRPESMPAGIESCTAPVFGLPVERIALAYARLVNPVRLLPTLRGACQKILRSMLAHPELVGGSQGRLCTDIMRCSGGAVLAKCGAEAVFALAVLPSSNYPDGLGIAIKIEDGSERAIAPVVVEVLTQLELLGTSEKHELADWRHKKMRNFRGDVVGEFVPTFELS